MMVLVGTILRVYGTESREGYAVASNGGADVEYDIEVRKPDGSKYTVRRAKSQNPPYRGFVDVIVPPATTKVPVYQQGNRFTFDVTVMPWHEDCDSQGGDP